MTIAASHAETNSYRPAQSRDLDAIEALLRANDLPIDGVAAALRDFLVAETNGEIIGVVGIEYCGPYALLRSLAVASRWRGRRIARKLVELIIRDAQARGVRAVYLLTTTAESWFPRFGFRATTRGAAPDEIRETGEFRGACPASATVMWLSLLSS